MSPACGEHGHHNERVSAVSPDPRRAHPARNRDRQAARLEAAPDPFRHRIVVIGSSITHGSSASRPGMTYTARLGRTLGFGFINLGASGQCKLDTFFARIAAETRADAFLFDVFSNPSAAADRGAAGAFRAANPRKPSHDAADIHPDCRPRKRELRPPEAGVRSRQAGHSREGMQKLPENGPEHLFYRARHGFG